MDNLKVYGSSDNEINDLVKPVRTLSGCIGMKFCMSKCDVLKKKKEENKYKGMMIEEAKQEANKYFGVIKKKHVYQDEMKEMMRKDYLKQGGAFLKPSLSNGNVITALKT